MGQTQSSHRVSKQDEYSSALHFDWEGEADSRDRAILAMKLQRDKLHQYQKKMTKITAHETDVAKECLRRGEKSRALLILRRKKLHETLLSNTDLQLAQLEQLVHDVEFARVQKDVVFGLQQGTQVLKEIQREMGGVEGVEKILAEGEEAKAYQLEMSEMLAGKISNADEDEVESELEALEREINGVKESPAAQDLPAVPTDELQRQETQKERWERRQRQQQEEREALVAV